MEFYQSRSKSRVSSTLIKSLKRQSAAKENLPKFQKFWCFIKLDQIIENTRRSPWNFTKVGQSQDVHQNLSNPQGQDKSKGILPKFVKVSSFTKLDQILENTLRSLWNFTKVCQSQDVQQKLSSP